MSIIEYARKELELIGDDGDEMQAKMNEHVLEMVKTFEDQGHSGLSAAYAINQLQRLLNFKPLKPLTGEDDEWTNVHDDSFQNKRCSTVFKEGQNNITAYNIEGRIFSDDDGKTFFTSKESFMPITFPYEVPEKPEEVFIKDEKDEDEENDDDLNLWKD